MSDGSGRRCEAELDLQPSGQEDTGQDTLLPSGSPQTPQKWYGLDERLNNDVKGDWNAFTKQTITKSSTVLTDPVMTRFFTGLMQKPGCSGSQNFRIGWLNCWSVLGQYIFDIHTIGR